MRTGIRKSTVILLAVSESDAAAEIARHRGLRTAQVLSPGSAGLEGRRVTAVYATDGAREHPAFADALEVLRRCVAKSTDLLPERVA
jgi:hypothetical protein